MSVNYYAVGEIETIEFIKAKLSKEEFKGFLKGNVIKYISRSLYKSDETGDYKKAAYYSSRLADVGGLFGQPAAQPGATD